MSTQMTTQLEGPLDGTRKIKGPPRAFLEEAAQVVELYIVIVISCCPVTAAIKKIVKIKPILLNF